MEQHIESIFREYGENFFGKHFMDTITNEQIETARCGAFKMLQDNIEYHMSIGCRHIIADEVIDVEELFCNYIFEHFC